MLPVSPGIFRSPQPKSLLEFQWLHAQGIKTILDLENERGEAVWEKQLCEEAGIWFDTVPLSAWSPPNPSRVAVILGLMKDEANHPILVHCLHGQDRTGYVVGMHRRTAQNWSRDDAWTEMLDHGFHRICWGLTWAFWSAQANDPPGRPAGLPARPDRHP